MIKGKKIIFLVLALLLPVAVFLFLKMFGENEFNVPVMHQEGKIEAPKNCNFRYTTPYRIPDSIRQSLDLNDSASLYVMYFDPALANSMRRVPVEIRDRAVKVISPDKILRQNIDLNTLKECILLMEPPNTVVLVHDQAIRGYYNGADLDEMDRLIVELKIILKQY